MSNDTYADRLVAEAMQQANKPEPPQDADIIKLTQSQIAQVEKMAAALGLAFGVMLNSAAKYAVFYAQGRTVPVNQLNEYPEKVGTDSIKEKITVSTWFKLKQAGMKEYLSECIITGIQLLYKQLIASDDSDSKPAKALIDTISNKPPPLKRKLGQNWMTQI
ncbi:hypothetical protein PN36_06365 [Candidatus Thiomargarita nelsonii]|uniref:Uncharacterized protein n=1 Tax=Candidatus Thiomargarita nelsonii TaxID=1003181 RepID=A0A0A6S2Q2_9GAMM|nr:hypothetical protein PN36_06365 [Candidatus Thiomargarita nelsonii]